jgi:H+-transporting ATPase
MVTGLSTQEAARRLAEHGRNEVEDRREPLAIKIFRHFWAPVPWMLEATIALQLAVGERVEAAMIAALLVFNVALGVFQEGRANAALALLKQRLALRTRVLRDGKWTELPAAELVPGDAVQLSLAGIVPADLRIVQGSALLDQSMLTGESLAVDSGPGKTAYAGSQVRRGEAIAEVTATGKTTYFGRTAELVRTAHVETAEVKAVLGLVRNLSIINAAIVIALVSYAYAIALPTAQIIMLVLTAMLSAVPVALPATFTLGAAIGARNLARKGVLLTRLSALNEAATIDVLCADKTGTLTENKIAVAAIRPCAPGITDADLLGLAALASSTGGSDPIDTAIRHAAQAAPPQRPLPALVSFRPFDPATKRAEATVRDETGRDILIVKGAPAALASFAPLDQAAAAELEKLSSAGYRTIAVVAGPADAMAVAGLIALADPPRADSAQLLSQLRELGVSTVMVTGDTATTARSVGRAIGIAGAVCPAGPIPERVTPEEYAIYAGVFPEQKFRLVKALQQSGHAVGMCGDGANDAPALRQAQMGIAVESATDIAKAAAGVVLTTPGLGGIVSAVEEGRAVFQRVLTYTIGILVNKVVTLIVLGAGLVMTGHAVLTPMLQALAMLTNDFVSMARTADRARPSSHPNAWRLRNMMIAAIPLAAFKLLVFLAALALGAFRLGFSASQMQTLTFVMFVFAGQALVYVLRERGRLWRSRPSLLMMAFSLADIAVVAALAVGGILMAPLPAVVVAGVLGAAVLFALALDQIKVVLFHYLPVD